MSGRGSVGLDQLAVLWEDGERRLRAAEAQPRRRMEQIIDVIVLELRRRLSGPFSADDLAELYLAGTDWCFELAMHTAPAEPEAWDMPTVVGAAFHRYLRRAMDYGGGRRRLVENED